MHACVCFRGRLRSHALTAGNLGLARAGHVADTFPVLFVVLQFVGQTAPALLSVLHDFVVYGWGQGVTWGVGYNASYVNISLTRVRDFCAH